MNDQPYYITTSIFYPNDKPHMGHALEVVQADMIARYHRFFGERVFFQTGLDEHGLKMQRAAEKSNREVMVFVESQTKAFQVLLQTLHISHDNFVRTTSDVHQELAQAFWAACMERGDIYKKSYKAWYNVKQEEFIALVEDVANPGEEFGIDPQFIEMIEEENYFFKASKYTAEVTALLKSGEYAIFPENRRTEMVKFVETAGLKDISISRAKEKLSWGVPVPGDDSQVMYVWFDALTNYLTGIGHVEESIIRLNDFWPANLHCVGKDISRFHALLWPAMLCSAGIALPKGLFVHGFVLKNGRVMSKSVGNVIDPLDVCTEYSADALRWYLLRSNPIEDIGFTEELFAAVYSADLANDYGNLVSRVVSMAHKYCEGRVPSITSEQVDNLEKAIVEEKWREYHAAFEKYALHEVLETAHALMVFCNRRIEELKPWDLAKDEATRQDLEECLYELLEMIRHISLMVLPIMPATVERIAAEVFPEVHMGLWTAAGQEWGLLPPGSHLGQPLILFPRKEA